MGNYAAKPQKKKGKKGFIIFLTVILVLLTVAVAASVWVLTRYHIVAGEFYGNEEVYMKQIKDFGIQDRVELHTYFIPDNKVNNYFCAADIVAQPYKSATQSGVTQIAFHFEKSMLVTNVGGLPEIVPHGKIGYVVEPDTDDIAKALIDFYENNREQEYENNVKLEKQKYAWSNMIKAFDDLAKSIQ